MGRDWYLEGWEKRTVNENGKDKVTLVYVGQYYGYSLKKDQMKKLKLAHAVLALLIAAFFVATALVDPENYEQYFVGLPFLLVMIPYMPYFVGVVLVISSKEKMTYRDFYASYRRIDFYAKAMFILLCVAAAGGLVSVFLALFGSAGRELIGPRLLWLLCDALCALCCAAVLWLQRRYPCRRLVINGKKSK